MGCGKSTGKVTNVVILPKQKQRQSPVSTVTSAAPKEDPAAVKGDSSGGSRMTFRPSRLSDLAALYRSPTTEPTLRLEYVYGYNSKGAGNNLFYLSATDQIVYPAASLCVLLSANRNTQSFLGGGEVHTAKGHMGELSAVALSPSRDLIATGENAELPAICLWKLQGTEPLLTIDVTGDSKGTKLMAFSQDSGLLAAIDLNTEATVRLYEVKSGLELLVASGTPGNIQALAWSPSTGDLWTAGQGHFSIWSNKNAAKYQKETKSGLETVTVLGFRLDGTAVVGGNEGKIMHLAANTEMIASYPLHPASVAITALFVSNEGVLVGAANSKVTILDANFQQLRLIDTPGVPFSLDQSASGILCGTRDGAIVEFGRNGRMVLMDVHSVGEVSALAYDKVQTNCVLSSGGDNKLKCWNIQQKRCMVTGLMEMGQKTVQTRALDVSIKGHVAIGYDDGHFTVRTNSFQLNNIVAVGKGHSSAITTLKYSPDGLVLALGTEAGLVTLHSARLNYPILWELKGHKGRITALDWSKEGSCLRSQDLFLAEKVWKVESGEVVPREKEQDWGTENRLRAAGSEFGPSVGAKSPTADMFIQGGLNGLLEVYNSQSAPLAFKAHSSLIRSAVWSPDGQTLLTAGGQDLSLLQWKLT